MGEQGGPVVGAHEVVEKPVVVKEVVMEGQNLGFEGCVPHEGHRSFLRFAPLRHPLQHLHVQVRCYSCPDIFFFYLWKGRQIFGLGHDNTIHVRFGFNAL